MFTASAKDSCNRLAIFSIDSFCDIIDCFAIASSSWFVFKTDYSKKFVFLKISNIFIDANLDKNTIK
jgi:hypothetical protein